MAISCIGFDAEWQYPAITERHAYKQCMHFLHDYEEDIVYFGFPWATLIDILHTKGEKEASSLLSSLDTSIAKLNDRGKIERVTVCQHIKMIDYIHLFHRAGIDHIFWPHAIQNSFSYPLKLKNIKIHPFPLFPVQYDDDFNLLKETIKDEEKYLFSFVGAKSNPGYLTKSRDIIIDTLSNVPEGLVVSRDTWHYNRVVYDHQIHKKTDLKKDDHIDQSASNEFRQVLKKSIFSLCPSGSGPNSIRLWESIGFGVIPVILADTLQLPGNIKIWKDAAVFCEETEQAIKELPNRLKNIAKKPDILNKKRQALKQIWLLYGPDCFIYDIKKMFLEFTPKEINIIQSASNHSYEQLLEIANIAINNTRETNAADIFILGCCCRARMDSDFFLGMYYTNSNFKNAYKLLIGKSKYGKLMTQIIKLKGISLI